MQYLIIRVHAERTLNLNHIIKSFDITIKRERNEKQKKKKKI